MRALVLLATLISVGCAGFTHVEKQCPTCRVVEAGRAEVDVRPDARTLWILVPGLLGFGWEWDRPIARLRREPSADFVVFWWRPFSSLAFAGAELHQVLTRILLRLPSRVTRVVVVGHSVGGMVAAEALRELVVPDWVHLTVVTIGTPFAGMALSPDPQRNPRHVPLYLALSGVFDDYADPPARTDVIEYVTSYPADPVMQPHNGRQPAPPGVGPAGARRITVDPKADHNQIVDYVVGDVLSKRR